MSVEFESEKRINNLIAAANATTGNSDSDLTSAVSALINGFGSGSSDDRYDEGFADGKVEGIVEGKQSEYDRFWDAYQQDGERQTYTNAFYGESWTSENFKPKYSIHPTIASGAFRNFTLEGDLTKYCTLDMSRCKEGENMFNGSLITKIGIIDLKHNPGGISAGLCGKLFSGAANLVEIEEIIFYSTNTYCFSGTFTGCSALKEVRFSGELKNYRTSYGHLNLADSKQLSKASIVSCIGVLSLDTTGKSVTFSEVAVNKAFETAEGANDGSTSDEWSSLVATKKPAWTIALA